MKNCHFTLRYVVAPFIILLSLFFERGITEGQSIKLKNITGGYASDSTGPFLTKPLTILNVSKYSGHMLYMDGHLSKFSKLVGDWASYSIAGQSKSGVIGFEPQFEEELCEFTSAVVIQQRVIPLSYRVSDQTCVDLSQGFLVVNTFSVSDAGTVAAVFTHDGPFDTYRYVLFLGSDDSSLSPSLFVSKSGEFGNHSTFLSAHTLIGTLEDNSQYSLFIASAEGTFETRSINVLEGDSITGVTKEMADGKFLVEIESTRRYQDRFVSHYLLDPSTMQLEPKFSNHRFRTRDVNSRGMMVGEIPSLDRYGSHAVVESLSGRLIDLFCATPNSAQFAPTSAVKVGDNGDILVNSTSKDGARSLIQVVKSLPARRLSNFCSEIPKVEIGESCRSYLAMRNGFVEQTKIFPDGLPRTCDFSVTLVSAEGRKALAGKELVVLAGGQEVVASASTDGNGKATVRARLSPYLSTEWEIRFWNDKVYRSVAIPIYLQWLPIGADPGV